MNIIIVDDDPLITSSLKRLIEIESDIKVSGIARNGKEAFELCRQLNPDVVLMDIRMPEMDGVLGTRLIKNHFKNIKVVLLTTFKDEEYIKEAIKSGAEGYILKNQDIESIVDTLKTVAKGNTVLEKEVAATVSSMLRGGTKRNVDDLDLSQRELEILRLLAEGMSNKEISEKLIISEGTVRNYITVMLDKLGFRDRTQLAVYFIRNYE